MKRNNSSRPIPTRTEEPQRAQQHTAYSQPRALKTNSRASVLLTLTCLTALAALGIVLGTCIGSTGFESPFAAGVDSSAHQIIWDIRLPRTLGAWLVGALLGLAGALAQGLFRNPLADPYLLGSASGASLGVALAALVSSSLGRLGSASLEGVEQFSGLGYQWVLKLGFTGAAFIGAVSAVLLTLLLARGVEQTLRLLLGGVIVGIVLGSINSLVLMMQPQMILPLQSFLLGSTALLDWESVVLMAIIGSLCLLIAWPFSKALDALSLGEETAVSLGIHFSQVRLVLTAALALAVGCAVAQSGLIAFVGLAAPHLVRSLLRVQHKYVLLLASCMGGNLLLVADLGARCLIAPQELPVGVLTAILGGGYLVVLMHRQSTRAHTS